MSAKFIPIMQICSEFLDEWDKSVGDMDKAYIMALRGLEQMHFNISAEPKTVRLAKNPNQTVTLPADYVQWIKIGLINANGEVVTLKVNNSLTTFKDDSPDRLSFLTPDINNSLLGNNVFLNYYLNGVYTPLFGIGGGLLQPEGCRIDEKNNIIVLATDYQYPDVLLEYISCPEKDPDYQVDRRAREALIAFIAWKFRLGDSATFYARLTEYRRMIKPVHLSTFNEVIREGYKFCLKC
jgi:hypothetical protein